jgi:UDP-glucose 4-epimerase
MTSTNKVKGGLPKVLVLGGLGFVGRHVCKHLSNQGVEVYSLGHGTIPDIELKSYGIMHWAEARITENSLAENFQGINFNAVIHCAGSGAVSLSFSHPIDDFHRSVTSVFASLDFVRKTQPKNTRFVLASSAAVYGNHNVVLSENARTEPVSPYGIHKRMAEMICAEYNQFFGVSASIVRLFSVYGTTLKKQLLWDAANKFKLGKSNFFGTGEEMRDWIHVTDAAALLVDAALKKQSTFEIYNGGNVHASTKNVLTQLASALGSELDLMFNGEKHIGNPSCLICSHQKACDMLGWKPQKTLETGLLEYARWFKEAHA